jgi:hypothetical protein
MDNYMRGGATNVNKQAAAVVQDNDDGFSMDDYMRGGQKKKEPTKAAQPSYGGYQQ